MVRFGTNHNDGLFSFFKKSINAAFNSLSNNNIGSVLSLRDIKIRLISELMKNSRRSDRELAKAIGTSQPTVSRLIKKLEKEGIIKEYTMLPDFRKLGFKIIALTFIKLKSGLSPEVVSKARQVAEESLKKGPFEFIMLERGMGLGFDGLAISLHEDYSSYMNIRKWILQFDFIETEDLRSFIIDLDDKVHYRPLTLSFLARYILTMRHVPL